MLVLSDEGYVEKVRSCLGYRLQGPYIVIENKCSESFDLDALEVKYYITVLREEEYGHGRREITERINIGKSLGPHKVLDVYFGPVENLSHVFVVARVGESEYRAEISRVRGEEEEG